MFTGIVEEIGRFRAVSRSGPTTRLEFSAALVTESMTLGDSIAVNGCCVTVVEFDAARFAVEAVEETLSRTNLGDLSVGDAVNLERPVAVGERLGGHLVQGHVDAVGEIFEPPPHLCVSVPDPLLRYLVEKGSVTIDGVSLTVVSANAPYVRVEVIPHTIEVTTLGERRPGDRVNLEVDVVAKYVERLLSSGAVSAYSTSFEGGSSRAHDIH